MSDENAHKMNLDGVEVSGVKVSATDVHAQADAFEIILSDGARVRYKPVLLDAVRDDGQRDAKGDPTYYFQFGLMMMSIEVPESLKRQV